MYQDYFGLREPPFRITPDPAYFFPGAQRGAILDALGHAIREGHGIVKVVGEVGSGKTMLCRMLATHLGEYTDVVYLANPNLGADEILTAIAQELGLPAHAATGRQETLRLLNETLLERHAQGRRVVAFIEEAQGMPLTTLEEVRLLSNLETERHKLLQMILFGQPELDRHLSAPQIRQLRERITASFDLPPLTRGEVADYLRFRLAAAGWRGPDLFPAPLAGAIARASKGLTRRINIVADKTLLSAFAEQSRALTMHHVRAALADAEFRADGYGGLPALAWLGTRGKAWALGGSVVAAIALAIWVFMPGAPETAVPHAPPPIAEAPRPILDEAPTAVEPEPAEAALPEAILPHVSAPSASPAHPAAVPHQATGPGLSARPVQSAKPASAPTPPVAPATATAAVSPAPPAAKPQPEPGAPPAFAIQLLAGGKAEAEKLAQEARDLGFTEELQLLQVEESGKSVWKLMFGHYPDRDSALLAMGSLPEALAQRKPFIRDISGFRSEP